MSTSPVCLITAGSAGLGAATARLFATAGYRVAINYHSNNERANSIVAELEKLSTLTVGKTPNFTAVKADVSKKEEITRLVEKAVSSMGRLDVVYSNHGWTEIRGLHDLDANIIEDDWDRCFNMNVKSHLWLMHAAKPHLDATEGAFITTASLAGVRASGSSLAYSATKAAQIHMVKGLALIAAPKIRVNSVAPGLLLTEWGLRFPQKGIDAHIAKTKLGKVATVEDVAEQVLCYAKSRTVTGQNAVIDAGFTV